MKECHTGCLNESFTEVEVIRFPSEADWMRCLFLARITQGSERFTVPSENWRRNLIASEHSPARTLPFTIALWGVPYFVSVHLVRHKFGVEHYVKSQRSNPNRGESRQDARVNHVMDLNLQALINMARKRLCVHADATTRAVMNEIRTAVIEKDPIYADFLVPDCIYRGGCYEFTSCGYYDAFLAEKDAEKRYS